LILAVGTALLQIIMKGISRSNLPGKNHGLSRDDALFWTDWTVAASLALAGSIVAAAGQGKTIPLAQVLVSFFAIVLSCSAFPFCLRVFAYGPNAQMKTWGWKGAGWLLISNFIGILVLLVPYLRG
jgi:hypothetical protein